MSHNFLLDLYEFIDDQLARPCPVDTGTPELTDVPAWVEGRASAWIDLRRYVDSQLFVKLPKRLQKKLAPPPNANGR